MVPRAAAKAPAKEGSAVAAELGRATGGRKRQGLGALTAKTPPNNLPRALAKAMRPMGPGDDGFGGGDEVASQKGLGRCCRVRWGQRRSKTPEDEGSGGRNPAQTPSTGAGEVSEADGAGG